PVILGEPRPIPVAPDVGINAEVGRTILYSPRIVPKSDGHAGKCPGTHQLPFPAVKWPTVGIEDLYRHPQAPGLQLSSPDRRDRIAQGEAGDDVGPPTDAREMDIRLDRAVDIVVTVPGQRAPGGKNGAKAGEVVSSAGLEGLLF